MRLWPWWRRAGPRTSAKAWRALRNPSIPGRRRKSSIGCASLRGHNGWQILREYRAGYDGIAADVHGLLFQVDLHVGDESYRGDGRFLCGADQIERISRSAIEVEDNEYRIQ